MKCFSLLILLISLVGKLDSQTAEEILWKTQGAYRALSNYVDEDMYLIPPNSLYVANDTLPDLPDTFWYVMALDRKQNVNYWFQRHTEQGILNGSFKKTEKETTGLLRDGFFNRPDMYCSIAEAGARLNGRRQGKLSLIASLMYPDLSPESAGDSSILLHYDTSTRIEDTTINGIPCYVVKIKKTNTITQEMADKVNYQRDSLNGLLTLDPELRGGPHTEAGPVTYGRKYIISKNDFILLRVEYFNYKGDTETKLTQATTTFNPKLNVKDFKKYMEE